jgi:hypothetical protein
MRRTLRPLAALAMVVVIMWAMAMARTMDSPRPWWSSTRVESLEGLEEERPDESGGEAQAA